MKSEKVQHKKDLAAAKAEYKKDLEKRDKKIEDLVEDSHDSQDRQRQATETLTNAIINGLQVRTQGNQRADD